MMKYPLKNISKEKVKIKVKHWITSHPWLKLIALILAVMVWFYVKDEISKFNY